MPHQEDGNEGEKHEAEYRAEEDHAAAYIAQRRTKSGGWWSPRRRHGSGTKSRSEAPVTPHRARMIGTVTSSQTLIFQTLFRLISSFSYFLKDFLY